MTAQNTFQDLYREALANFNNESDEIDVAIGLGQDRLLDLRNKIINHFEEMVGDKITRSEAYQELLYITDPKSLIEVFAVGYLIGLWEGDTLSSPDLRSKLVDIAILTTREAVHKIDDVETLKEMFNDFLSLVEESN